MKASITPYVSLREVREYYNIACEECSVKPSADFEENLQTLIDMDIVEMKSLKNVGLLGVSAEDLDRFPEQLNKAYEASNEG